MSDEQVDETAGATRDGSPSEGIHLTRRSRRDAESAAQTQRPTPRTRPVPVAPVAVRTPVLATVAPVRRRRGRVLRTTVSTVAAAAIAGMVAVMALPAYSFDTAPDSQAAIEAAARIQALGNQKLTVASTAVQEQVIRDSFTAPTQAQLDEASRQAAVLQNANGGGFSTVQTRAVGDDYPWPYETIDDDGGGLSPLGYYYRECVDFVAWRLNRDAGATAAPWKYTWGNITPMGGSAWEWPDNWAAKGWATSSVPIVGCVAWWTYNHVSYVQQVNDDGTVLLEEYNYGGRHSYVTRTFPTAQVPLFLYPPAL